MRRAVTTSLAALALTSAAGCGPSPSEPSDAAVDVQQIEASLIARRDGGVVALDEDVPLEVYLGFQGFKYAEVQVVSPREVPEQMQGSARIAVEGYDPVEVLMNRVRFRPSPDGRWTSDPMMVFVNDVNLGDFNGRRYTLTLDVWTRTHRAHAESRGVVFHDTTCVISPSGACTRRDGGT